MPDTQGEPQPNDHRRMKSQTPPDYREMIGEIARKRGALVTVFSDFCRIAACCLAVQTREEEYLEVAGRYTRDELEWFAKALGCLILEMEQKPFEDVLGPYYLEVASKATQDARGEFYTPRPISQLIARMLFDPDKLKEENRAVSVWEPACGAGGMVLAIGELLAPSHVDLLRITCWDLNPVAADMCYINTTLWGIPAEIVWGDTIRNIRHRSWKNIHWARVGEDMRKLFLELGSSAPQTAIDLPCDRAELFGMAFEQMDFDL